jgi:hypothetical protein
MGLSTDFALIWAKKIVQKARFLVNAEYMVTILRKYANILHFELSSVTLGGGVGERAACFCGGLTVVESGGF